MHGIRTGFVRILIGHVESDFRIRFSRESYRDSGSPGYMNESSDKMRDAECSSIGSNLIFPISTFGRYTVYFLTPRYELQDGSKLHLVGKKGNLPLQVKSVS